ncbi:hypothetical protein B0T17DRAFT_504516 [Bombardia bombarda]|uniref:Uncharacterized protein n=1 Tax=Bombardia bombarda TaxID=252184 RepID=A0AA39XN78_9PEZI|nr:hypothetical protein B0T17DRAFT_504516 [Bombardia bombarda]
MCENLDGVNAPFCSPREGAQVQVGTTIDVTWDPALFNTSITPQIRVQGDFSTTSPGGTDGFSSVLLDPNSGRYSWTILDEYLDDGATSLAARLFIAEPVASTGTNTNAQDRIPGPRVQVVRAAAAAASETDNTTPTSSASSTSPTFNSSSSSINKTNTPNDSTTATTSNNTNTGPNPLSIALPIGVGVLALLLISAFFTFKKRNHPPGAGNLAVLRSMLFSSSKTNKDGYGVGQSRGQRFRGGSSREREITIVHHTHMVAQGLRMNTMAGGDNGNGNVFREEMRRQERMGV